MDITTDVLIVGAGGGGAVLGIALGRKGIANLVLEQAGGPPQGIRGGNFTTQRPGLATQVRVTRSVAGWCIESRETVSLSKKWGRASLYD